MTTEEKKNILDKAIDLVTNRDEQAELAQLQQQLAQAQAAAKSAAQQLATLQSISSTSQAQSVNEMAAARKAAEDANKRAAEADARFRELQAKLNEILRAQEQAKRQQAIEERLAAEREAAKPKFIATHTLTSKETLSHLSLKYYGSATKPYWMVIYEANKDVIGDNPNHVRKGLVINIPELPPELKKK